MTPEERIKEYFANTTPEQVYADLVECGLYEIESWEEAGVRLLTSKELSDSIKENNGRAL